MRPGGAGWPARRCRAGAGQRGPGASSNSKPKKTTPDPKALCGYGLLRADTAAMLLRFVQGRPVSQVTEEFLGWLCERLAAGGRKALLLHRFSIWLSRGLCPGGAAGA
jgi:hypothetical protein